MNNRGSNMLKKDKILNLNVPFSIKQNGDEEEEGLRITGHASTNDEDRSGDIIASDAWKKAGALDNYLKNPIILAFHDMSQPIGKTISHEVKDDGLNITAQISKAAGNITQLIKEGILSAFSVGFQIKDADFDPKSGIFMIKELELLEVSVVSIPANQNALFSIEKNFSDPEEYKEFRKQFIKSESKETLMVDKTTDADNSDLDMAALAAQISSMVKGDLKAEKKAADEAKAKAEEELKKVTATASTAAEKLIKDLREELVEKDATMTEALKGIRDEFKKAAESGELKAALDAENPDNKMKYLETSEKQFSELSSDVKDGMLYVSKVFGMPITETKTFKDFVKKSNMEHWDAGVTGEWEDEYSTRVQNALRQQLVVEPLFSTIPMSTPTLNMPINPDAGDADWVHSAAYRSSQNPADETGGGSGAGAVSTGAAVDHTLDEQVLIAYKLATREYIGYEEEEDSIVTLAPIINEAVARRMANATDLALLRGAGVLTNTAAYDPILGLEGRGANTTDVTVSGGAAWRTNIAQEDFADMRRNLVLYGLDPSQNVLLVSHDVYYEMIKFPDFQTVNTYGPLATLHTGEVGSIYGVKVLVSQNFDNAAITTGTIGTTLAIMCRPSNFLLGSLRGIMTEADRDIINQKRVIVSSRRFAFQDVITGEGTVNLQISSV
jgi:HK97 family phage prohead protease/HK97 family phage major capsid protein